jgi:cytochrome c oxidase assembly protein subunit 15
MKHFQKVALFACAALLFLLFMGALVRATGSGLGCPDWPKCYGKLIPPTQAQQIDFQHLDLEKYRRKASQFGRDPQSITPESVRAEFNATHTWIEFLNRLASLPLGLAVLGLCVLCWPTRQKSLILGSLAALGILLANAWLGARVVYSGLKPGVITTHMALAIVLLILLVFLAWRAALAPWRLNLRETSPRLFWLALTLFALCIAEGILGTQIREMTDSLAKTHAGQPRFAWTAELESTWVYLIHRSGSWAVLAAAIAFGWEARRCLATGLGWLEYAIVGIILAQMVLGIVLAHVGILPTAQLLHVILSAFLVAGLTLWLLGFEKSPFRARS